MRSAQSNSLLLAEAQVVPRAVNLIGQHRFGIIAEPGAVAFRCGLQRLTFVEAVPGQLLPECVAVHHADRQLRPELDVRAGFTAHDRPHVRLRDTDYPIRYAVRTFVVHRLLLANQFLNDQKYNAPIG